MRRRYIAEFYGHRFWAAPGAFDREDVDVHDRAVRRRARSSAPSIAQLRVRARAARALSEAPRLFETNPMPTLVLYGPEDHVIWRDFPARVRGGVHRAASGPFVVPGAGHFLQWERAEVLNSSLNWFCRNFWDNLRPDEPGRNGLQGCRDHGPVRGKDRCGGRDERRSTHGRGRAQGRGDTRQGAQGRRARGRARAQQAASKLDADARHSASAQIEEAQKESEQIREQTQRQIDGRVAAADEAATQVLEEAKTLSSGLRHGDLPRQSQGQPPPRPGCAHKRMQADLRVEMPDLEVPSRRIGASERRPAASEGRPGSEATPEEREALERAASELRGTPRRRERRGGDNPFDDLDVPSWVER